IDGNNMSRLGSLISVHADSNMNIGEDAIIRNSTSTESDGGAIWVEGTMYIGEGSIYGSSAPNGGAIYVAPGGYLSLYMDDTAKIQNNTATSGAGGGIYIAEGATLSGYSDSIPFVTGNFAEIPGTENFALYGNWLSAGMVYVSQNGTGDGSSLEFPTSFATALSSTNSNVFTLLEDISISVGITLNRYIVIESENPTQKRAIYPSETLSTPLITISEGSLYLENVFIGAATQTSSIESLIKVENESTLFVGTGAVIRNHTRTSGNGGGIYANGSQIIFDGGEIYDCSAPQGNGGAVYLAYDSALQSGSSLSITNSTIGSTDIAKKNSAQNGGGIFVENLSQINFLGSALVQNNTALNNGGGIYIAAGGSLYMQETTNSITGNTAGQIGGGAYMEAEGALIPSEEFFSTYCTGNTATTSSEFYVYVNNPYG
ncbi:MAG TPA: hypothetical protein VJ861_12115, partial [Treponemataceae bacterium]|nr:hypothetical protein [Treponemataceae bacterium]